MNKLNELLESLNACSEATIWANTQPDLQTAWANCQRGDWMLWLYKRMYPDNLRELTLAKGLAANTVRHLMKDERSIAAVDAAIAFGEGKISADELESAYAAAVAAADAADAAADAADDAAAAADAAYYAAVAAADAAYAAAADAACADAVSVADAAYTAYAAYAAARKENQQLTADICRKYLNIWTN